MPGRVSASDSPIGQGEFAIRVASIDALFSEFDARPVAGRMLGEEVRGYLIDTWELVRAKRPASLTIYAPDSDRATTDAGAVVAAVRSSIRTFAGPYRHAVHFSRRQRVTAWVGTVVFLATIIVSTALERLTEDVFVAGVSQAIVVIGWVALWAPAQYVVVDAIPHRLTRRRYAEFADIDVRISWEPSPAASRAA